jgi:hypothetical protein
MSVILNLQTSFRFCLCGYGAKFECDWHLSSDRNCGKPICDKHAKEVGKNKHLCPFHTLQYETWKRKHPEKVGVVELGVQPNLFEGAEA